MEVLIRKAGAVAVFPEAAVVADLDLPAFPALERALFEGLRQDLADVAVSDTLPLLVTAGTSICGGSAIAAVGPAIGARPEAMSVALATVFVLNAVDGCIPSDLGTGTTAEIEEERRLLYVAMTRATRKALLI